ncbi:MAG: hypothetical protein HXY34_01025 [Candidatus Thorarchaeota archaeon]|nr:hypothetical protein [Candidatus Thorarchaeota archaeon]
MRLRCFIVGLVAMVLFMLGGGVDGVAADEELVVVRGEDVILAAYLLQNGTYGNPVPDQRVEFFDETTNEYLGFGITDNEGRASILWTPASNHPLGFTVINATFRGNESLALWPSCMQSTFLLFARTTVHSNIQTSALAPSDDIVLTVTLLDDSGTPIIGGLVQVYGNDMMLAQGVTNSTGYIGFRIPCLDNWYTLGDNEIRIVYPGNASLFLMGAEDSLTVTIQRLETSLVIASELRTHVLLNESVNVHAKLQGAPPSAIGVFLDGIRILETSSNSSGDVLFVLTIDRQFTLGSHTLSLQYLGNERFSGCSISLELSVFGNARTNVSISERLVLGENSSFIISVTDDFNRGLPGLPFTVLDLASGFSSSGVLGPTSTGEAVVYVYGLVGPRGFLITLSNPYLFNSTVHVYTEVWIQPFLVFLNSSIISIASPNQPVTVCLRLSSSSGFLVGRQVAYGLEAQNTSVCSTDGQGVVRFTITAPKTDGVYSILASYELNPHAYELGCTYSFSLPVQRLMPVLLELESYSVVAPLQEVRAKLMARALNGTILSGLEVIFEWLSTQFTSSTDNEGVVTLFLPVPAKPGECILLYSIEESSCLSRSTGYVVLAFTPDQLMSAQGLGVSVFTFGILFSVLIALLPSIARRSLVE